MTYDTLLFYFRYKHQINKEPQKERKKHKKIIKHYLTPSQLEQSLKPIYILLTEFFSFRLVLTDHKKTKTCSGFPIKKQNIHNN